MKIFKKIIKTLLVFICSTIVIYFLFTVPSFYKWCNENQLILYKNGEEVSKEILKLDSAKIKEIGDAVRINTESMEMSLELSANDGDDDSHSLAEFYDPLGYSVWIYMQVGMYKVTISYIGLSILLGICITIEYIVITSKKLNNILKFVIGYLGVMFIIPPILQYNHFYRWIGLPHGVNLKPFYIVYTIVFAVAYITNYIVGVRMTKKLNDTIGKKKENKNNRENI